MKKNKTKNSLLKDIKKQKYLYLLVVPGFLIILIFHYIPLYGILIAFKKFNVVKGVWNSPWVGLKYFRMFFNNPLALRLIKNTFLLGLYSLLWGFPAPIILALLLNEIKNGKFKKLVQTVTYFPHFISIVIVVGLLKQFASIDGIFNNIRAFFGYERVSMFMLKDYFRTLFIGSNIWQGVGFGSIIYLAALTNVDPELYDAADIDGANRWQKVKNIVWPTIRPTTAILFILSIGGILGTDFQKVMLMYTPTTYEVADVIGTYVYREGLRAGKFEYGTAIGLMLSVISFIFVWTANFISKKVSENSLW